MRQRGNSKVQLLLGLAVTAILIVAAVRLVPLYANSYEFKDAIRTQAKFAGVERKSPEQIRDELFKKAQELNLPVPREQIQVVGRRGGVTITARYSVQVDLIVYSPTLSFDYSADTATAY